MQTIFFLLKVMAYAFGGLIAIAFLFWGIGTLIGGPDGGQLGGKIGMGVGALAGLGYGLSRRFA